MRASLLVVVVCAVGFDGGCRRDVPASAATSPAASCARSRTGNAALDAVSSTTSVPGAFTDPLLTHLPIEAVVDDPGIETFIIRVDAAARTDLSSVPIDVKIALQNDVWGLWQRLSRTRDKSTPSSSPHLRLQDAARALVVSLATKGDDVAPTSLPSALSSILSVDDGWREREIEIQSLQHERLFGNRRIFRVATRGDDGADAFHTVVGARERALFSTLIALDENLTPRRTNIVGDLEMLRFNGDTLVAARVFEFDPHGLRCPTTIPSLHEVDVVKHVPGVGANAHLISFNQPEPLVNLPCAQCHDNADAMTLPSTTMTVGERHGPLLKDIAALAMGLRPHVR